MPRIIQFLVAAIVMFIVGANTFNSLPKRPVAPYTPERPEFANLRNVQEILKTRKIRVGIIDSGSPHWEQDGILRYKSKIQKRSSYPDKDEHGALVIRAFTKNLAKQVTTPWKYVEIVYCEINKDSELAQFSKCLQFFNENQIDFVNMSWKFYNFSEYESTFLEMKSLTKKGVVITVSSGNEGSEVPTDTLCGKKIVNKICVGGVVGGKITKSSDFGVRVNAYDNFTVNLMLNHEEVSVSGTSFAAPTFLSRFIAARIYSPNKIYNFTKHYEALANKNRTIASQKTARK